MSITTEDNKFQYNGNDVITAFAFPRFFELEADLTVILTSAANVDTTQTLTTDYTTVGAGLSAGGTVTMIVPPATGEKLTIVRVVPITQITDFRNFDGNDADINETAIDRTVIQNQQQQEENDRSLRLPVTALGVSTELPLPQANRSLAWNATEDAIINLSQITGVANPMSAAESLIKGGTLGVPTDFPKGSNNTLMGVSSGGVLEYRQAVAADIADDAVTLAKMAPGTDGNIISYDASGNPVAVATGTSGQRLTSNGAGAAPTFQSGGGVLLDTQTASASSELDFTIGISSTFEVFKFYLVNIVAATEPTFLHLRVSTDGGSTFESAMTNYQNAFNVVDGNLGTSVADVNLATRMFLTENILGNAAGENLCGEITMFNPASSSLYTMFNIELTYIEQTGDIVKSTGAGSWKATTTVDGIRFQMESGNITSGTIYLYGISK